MINEKVIETLAPLNIPVAYMAYEGSEETYVMFQTYNENDSNFEDDESTSVTSYVELAFYYTNPADSSKAAQCKQLMKQAGFIFDGAQDVYVNGTYGKKFDFIFVEYV